MTLPRRLGFAAGTLLLLAVVVLAAFWHSGWRAYVIHTGSMTPVFEPGDLVLDRPARQGYAVGDVATFRIGPDERVTHRITHVSDLGIRTKGDANRVADVWEIPPGHVDGVVAHRAPHLGYLVFFLQQPPGVVGVMSSGLSLAAAVGAVLPLRAVRPGRRSSGPRAAVRGRTRRSPDSPAPPVDGPPTTVTKRDPGVTEKHPMSEEGGRRVVPGTTPQ